VIAEHPGHGGRVISHYSEDKAFFFSGVDANSGLVPRGELAGEDASDRRQGSWRCGHCSLKHDSLIGEPVEVRGGIFIVAVTAKVFRGKRVDDNQDNRRLVELSRYDRAEPGREHGQQRQHEDDRPGSGFAICLVSYQPPPFRTAVTGDKSRCVRE